MTSHDPFLPDDYEVPTKPGKFMKFKIGENKIRILAAPLRGWVAWVASGDKRSPLRRLVNDFKPGEFDKKNEPKHFWAMPVWDYADGHVKVLEITQSTIQKDIKALSGNKKWGHPAAYDITITALGEGMDREYTTMPDPKDDLCDEAVAAWQDTQAQGFDITRLLANADPFGQNGDSAPADDGVPF